MQAINFLHTQEQLQSIASDIITRAKQLGASATQLELSESISSNIEVLNHKIENFETSHESQMLLTVYLGQQKGHLGISNISTQNIDTLIRQALDIARYTEADSANGILEEQFLAKPVNDDLLLYHPHHVDNTVLIQKVEEIEQKSLAQSPLITASDGASASLTRYNFVMANSHGFNRGYQTSRYSNSTSIIATNQNGMQSDYWYSVARKYEDLLSADEIAVIAANRLLRRLNPGKFKTAKCKVIFETSIAKSIIGSLIGALNGNPLYRKLSFLNDSLGQQILPAWFNIEENPFLVQGLASCYFDNEGGKVHKRKIIDNGVVNGYLLSAYSARKLNMQPTGNAGGAHNLTITSNFSGNLERLAKEMGTGIIIIDTIGNGLNPVTGDYSVGASGLAVKDGSIHHFVDNLTIAGNMRDIFRGITHIADDSSSGSVKCGSMLIDAGALQIAT